MPLQLQLVADSPHGLDREQEQALAEKIQGEEPEEQKIPCVHELVLYNVRLAAFVVMRLMRQHKLLPKHEEDLMGEAFVALTNAAWGFKVGHGKFSTYAGTAIRNAVKDYMEGQGFFHIPQHMYAAVKHYEAICDERGFSTFEEFIAAGGEQMINERMAATRKSIFGKYFERNLKHAIFLLKTKVRSMPEQPRYHTDHESDD